MPRRPAIGIFSVPISKPRYTAVESQLTISPLCRSATASASALLPVAVGPRIARTRGLGMDRQNSNLQLEIYNRELIPNSESQIANCEAAEHPTYCKRTNT